MEFKTLRNIENSFKQIRLYAIVFALLCISIVHDFRELKDRVYFIHLRNVQKDAHGNFMKQIT